MIGGDVSMFAREPHSSSSPGEGAFAPEPPNLHGWAMLLMMHGQDEKHSQPDQVSLLSQDHRYLSESLWKNEQVGETRVNLLIGISTAVAGGIVALATAKNQPSHIQEIIVTALSGVLGLGMATLTRILIRNEATDRYKFGLDVIRETFKDLSPGGILQNYDPFGGGRKDRLRRKVAGLAQLVVVINSLLIAGLVLAIDTEWISDRSLLYAAAATAFLISFVLQYWYIGERHLRSEQRLLKCSPTHSGGVVYRVNDNVVQYLVVGPREETKHGKEWLLPKGHIEGTEYSGNAALREIREEAGVVGKLVCFLARSNFERAEEQVEVKYYLVEYLFTTRQNETRPLAWLPFDQALQALTYPDAQQMLRQAEEARVDPVTHHAH